MRVLVPIKATTDSEAGVMPSTELIEAMGRYNGELVEAVEWVKRAPNPMTPEQIEQEERMREDLYGQQSQQDPQADAFKVADA